MLEIFVPHSEMPLTGEYKQIVAGAEKLRGDHVFLP